MTNNQEVTRPQRSTTLLIRLTPADKAELLRLAIEQECSMSDIVHQLISKQKDQAK
jgi:hypothetical protein